MQRDLRNNWLISLFSLSIIIYFINQNPIIGYLCASFFAFFTISITHDYVKRILQFYKETPFAVVTNLIITLLPISYLFLWFNQENRYYTFNVDYRYFLSITNTIIRYGDFSNSLAYDGAEIQYHAAPSVISAYLSKVIALDPQLFFYMLLPIFANMSITLFVTQTQKTFFKQFNVNAILASSLIMTFSPISNLSSTLHLKFGLFNYSVMPNTIIGLMVIFMSLYSGQKSTNLTQQNITFVLVQLSLLTIKPQLIPIYAVVSILLLTMASPWDKKYLRRTTLIGVVTLSVLLLRNKFNLGVAHIPVAMKFDLGSIELSSIARDFPLMLLVFLGCVLTFRQSELAINRRIFYFNLVILSSLIFVKILLMIIVFELDIDTLNLQRGYNNEISWSDDNFDQGLVLLAIVGMAVGLLQILGAIHIKHSRRWTSQRPGLILSVFLIVVLILPTATLIRQPSKGYEAYDGKLQVEALNQIPISTSLIQVNDITDPAENYRRPGLGSYWSSFTTHQFYFSSFRYSYHLEKDVLTRISDTHSIFVQSDPRSKLRALGISHLLINKRCTSPLEDHFDPIYENDEFSLYSLEDLSKQIISKRISGAIDSQKVMFGDSRCL